MEMTTGNQQSAPGEDTISIPDLLRLCFEKWHWFAISLAIAIFLAFAYLQITPPVYERSASVMIKEDSKGNSVTADVSGLADMGLFKNSANVNNEIISFRAHALMLETVHRLGLDVDYKIHPGLHYEALYGSTLPVRVLFDGAGVDVGESQKFALDLLDGGAVRLSGFMVNGDKCAESGDVTGNMLDTIHTPLGKLVVTPTGYYAGKSSERIEVTRVAPASAARRYGNNLSVALNSKETTIIDLRLKDVLAQRAEEVLATMIAIYNENWVEDKNRIAVSTSQFINERLRIIETELGNVDDDIASYKSAHLVPDVAATSAMYMSRSNEVESEMQNLNNRLQMARYIMRYMTDNSAGNQPLPASTGIESSAIEGQIAEYNTMQLKRNSLVANSSEQNPLVVELDRSLAAQHRVIVASVENYVKMLDAEIKNLQAVEQRTTSQISTSPTLAKDLLTVERQQKVKEALYLFLLQKREENELSQTFAANNTRVVQTPEGSIEPIAPSKMTILAVAFAIGLIVPGAVIFLRESMNTKLRGRKDMDGLSVPLIGEIPLIGEKKGWFRKKHAQTAHDIVVEQGKRDVVNEAFRVLRTNLEFIAGQNGRSNVIAVTSFNAGSGKSFLVTNLAVCLAIKNKKVLIIDGDMRHASASMLVGSPDKGLSNLLNGSIADAGECIFVDGRHENIHVLPVGTLPPNPTELLESGRFETIVESMRNRYDYVFVDCPPVDLVADAQIIEKYTDRTIFVVRAGMLERSMLPELEIFYTAKRFKNIVAVLNATPGAGRYGYRFGYGDKGGYYNS